MKKQKICIIGGGLTGLITALTLSKLNLEVDLITGNADRAKKINRTIAISQDNYNFLKKLNVFKLSKRNFWPCNRMKLYEETKNGKFVEMFKIDKKNKIFYMIENSVIIKKLIFIIKKNKSIKLIANKKISEIKSLGHLKSVKLSKKNYYLYNLVIICTGNNSNLVKNLFKEKSIEHSYNEVSLTTTLNHSSFANNTARQVFLKKEIVALLPISNTKTSIVWTLNKNLLNYYKNREDFYLKKKLTFYVSNFIKRVKFNSNLEYKNLNFLIRKKYYKDRLLLFGDALHVVHPFVGQGFNMILRDLESFRILLKQKVDLGLDVGSVNILSELSDKIKPKNFAYAFGIDFIKYLFSTEKIAFKNLRNKALIKLNNNNFAKNLFFNMANKGINF